jgi:hypothetical protein
MEIPGARNGRPDQQHDAVGKSLRLVGPEVCVRGDQLRLSLGLVEAFKFEISHRLSPSRGGGSTVALHPTAAMRARPRTGESYHRISPQRQLRKVDG